MARRAKILLSVVVLSLMLVVTGCGNKEYTISFDSNGGSLITDRVITKGDSVPTPEMPTKEGYKFIGWTLDGETFDFSTIPNKNLKLVAKWEQDTGDNNLTDLYTVTFDSNGGSIIPSTTVEKDSKLTKPTNPTRDGYTFGTWKYNNQEWNFDNEVTSNMILVAEWDKVEETVKPVDTTKPSTTKPSTTKPSTTKPTTPTVTKYTVTFNSDGGTAVSKKTVEKGKTVAKPTAPTKKGYDFVAWTLDGKNYDFSKTVEKDITLKATWKAIPKEDVYTVSYENFQMGSPQVIVNVFKNGTKISATAVLNSSGATLGTYNAEFSTILVDGSEFASIAKIKLNDGTIVNVKK